VTPATLKIGNDNGNDDNEAPDKGDVQQQRVMVVRKLKEI
jgi:hypothetical protein